ncbi:MAG: hypothetical protein ACLGH0_04695, partial [Thermoanaerobaculia bacterium]
RVEASFFREPPRAVAQFPKRDDYRIIDIAHWMKESDIARTYQRSSDDVYWLARNSLSPMIPAAYGLRTVLEIDFDLTALLPTEDFTRSMWEVSEKRQDWLAVAGSMSNAWYFGMYRHPGAALYDANGVMRDVQPVRYLAGEQHPRYYFASQLVPIRSREEFVQRLATGRYAKRVAFVNGPAFAPAQGIVRSVRESANRARIEVEAASQAFLVMSVTPHKYWRVTIDGTEVPAIVTNIGYQGVVVPGGKHLVEMRYRNPVIIAGAALSLAALLLALWSLKR